ncbi:DUF983 domain-containing protein [Pontibacter liquoris]|uniref:DUF983 domain-containing protein n=1 Tax=Pontibacter liquoris TaxID=2905677 RepID=UPI001FA7DA56|nr:DUF983 domain-containing protein [Pontibacter liquoris]
MSQPSRLGAILACRCPRCRRGEVFTHSALKLRKFDEMHENCPVCGLHYEVELGFFWGAMYISYAFSVIIVLLTGISLYYLANDPDMWVYLTVVASTVLILTPILFRYARILLLHFFGGITYDPGYEKRMAGAE